MTKRRAQTIPMLISVPKDVRAWLEEQAARNLMPMTGLIVAAVRRQMDAERQEKAGRASGPPMTMLWSHEQKETA
jgi:hypothetical protein